MSDERPKIRRYHDPKRSPGDMTLWEALRDQANYADTDEHHSGGHRFTTGEIREVLDTIAQLRWDLAHAADWRGIDLDKMEAERDEARDVIRGALHRVRELDRLIDDYEERCEQRILTFIEQRDEARKIADEWRDIATPWDQTMEIHRKKNQFLWEDQ